MENETKNKKCLYDGIKISKRGLDIVIFTLLIITPALILYATVISQ